MAIGLVGRKIGMSRIFTQTGGSIPVTVVEVLPNRIVQVKSLEKEGHAAIQVTTGERSAARINKAEQGHFAKAEQEAGRGLWEFPYDPQALSYDVGGSVTVDFFQEGQRVDVTGTSKGKGFAGAIKRHNFRSQDMSHGNSVSHRAPGSIGQNQTPGRVFKGKRMAGHLGDERCTIQNLEVVRVDAERNLLLIKGAIPGCNTGDVIIKPSVKTTVVEAVTA